MKKCLGMENAIKWKMENAATTLLMLAFAHGIIWARTWSRIWIWHFIGNNKSSSRSNNNSACGGNDAATLWRLLDKCCMWRSVAVAVAVEVAAAQGRAAIRLAN